MAGFVYYIPNVTRRPSYDDLRAAGLGYAFELGRGLVATPVARGPGADASPGIVVADTHRVATEFLGYWPERQTWTPIPDSAAWCGFANEARPAPEDLSRPERIPGHLVELRDGHRWEIPVVRGIAEVDGAIVPYCPLPRRLGVDASGKFAPGELLPEHERLVRGVLGYYDAVREAAADGTYRFAFEDDVVVDLLQANYVLGRAEIVALGLWLWNGDHPARILNAAIDLPGFEKIEKKRAAAGSSTGPGPAGT